MMIKEYLGFRAREWRHDILATDISSTALEKAKKGVYHKDSIEKLPESLKRYFRQISKDTVEVKKEIREQVLFRRLNLMNKTYPFKGKFQVIFCRNVLIYFDIKTREEIAGKFSQVMEPGGYLFLGHTETMGRKNPYFRYVQPAVYQRV
jgi:chemotaxis protein methyltransferase CheR